MKSVIDSLGYRLEKRGNVWRLEKIVVILQMDAHYAFLHYAFLHNPENFIKCLGFSG